MPTTTSRERLALLQTGNSLGGLTLPKPPRFTVPERAARAFPELAEEAERFNRENEAFVEKIVQAITSRIT